MRISNKETFAQANVFGLGQVRAAYAQYFIGSANGRPEPVDGETYNGLEEGGRSK